MVEKTNFDLALLAEYGLIVGRLLDEIDSASRILVDFGTTSVRMETLRAKLTCLHTISLLMRQSVDSGMKSTPDDSASPTEPLKS